MYDFWHEPPLAPSWFMRQAQFAQPERIAACEVGKGIEEGHPNVVLGDLSGERTRARTIAQWFLFTTCA